MAPGVYDPIEHNQLMLLRAGPRAIRFLSVLRGCGGVESPPDLSARLADADLVRLSWLHRLLGHEEILRRAIIAGYVRGSPDGAGRAYALTNAAPDWLKGEAS